MLKHNYLIHTYLNNTKIITNQKLSKKTIEKVFFVLETYSKNLFFTNKEGDSYKFIYSQTGTSIAYGSEFYMYLLKLKKYVELLHTLQLFPIKDINEYILIEKFPFIIKKKEIDFDFTILVNTFILDHIYKILQETYSLKFIIVSNDLILLKENKVTNLKQLFKTFLGNELVNHDLTPKYNFIFKMEFPEQEKTIKGTFGTYLTVPEPQKIILISIANLYIAKIIEMFIKTHHLKSIEEIPDNLASFLNTELIIKNNNWI